MPVIELTPTAQKLIEPDPKRKFVSFTNEDAANKIYLSDKADPDYVNAKWLLNPEETLIIGRDLGYPERAFYGLSAGGNAKIAIGFQNDEE